jgi:branched-chain amino acid transport system permease protein
VDFQTALILAQDALTNGAIYILLAVALILVLQTTRILFIPQGEFVSYGALTLASLQLGKMPGTVWLLLLLAVIAAIVEIVRLWMADSRRQIPAALARTLLPPLVIAAIAHYAVSAHLSLGWQVLLTLLIVTPMGALVYRIAFRPLANAPGVVLFVAAVSVHFALEGFGLLFFGPEGVRTPPFTEAQFNVGSLTVSGQSVCVYAITVILIVLLKWFFGNTIYGKALRAVAFNRKGARLVGISPELAGVLAFGVAVGLGALSGILIGPITTVYYDSGFLIGLKGGLGAIVGGFASYPLAGLGALIVASTEAYSSYWVSAYKDIIVFTLIIPILLWRSMATFHSEEEAE